MTTPDPEQIAAGPDAWLYENATMLFKRRHRDMHLIDLGYTETPIFYRRLAVRTIVKDQPND